MTVAAATKVLLGSFTLENPGISETVRRVRGTMLISSDQITNIEEQIGAMGWIVVTDRALAAGAASIPGPVTDGPDDAWFLWEPFAQLTAGADLASTNITPPIAVPFDSKGMRKVDDPNVIAIMVENAHATNGLKITLGFSLLGSRTQ